MTRTAMHGTFAEFLTAWWRGWTQQRKALAELDRCGPEVQHIARDLGVTPADIHVVAAKRPDAAALLYQRLDALGLDAERIAASEGPVLRDLQRVCSLCTSKSTCARDLTTRASSPVWQTYCPNSQTLDALETEAEDKKAVTRLERRRTRARGQQ